MTPYCLKISMVRPPCLIRFALVLAALLTIAPARAVILDRIAIVVNSRVIKDSDIDRDIRITDFLNGQPLSFDADARKKSAHRLTDQALIRREVELGSYPQAKPGQVDTFLDKIKKQRFGSEAAYEAALRVYGITDKTLRAELQWQLTVLNFIDERFRPAVLVSDDEIKKYAATHPNMSRDQIEELLTGQKVNTEFDTWLSGAEKRAKLDYLEPDLQ